MQNEMSGDGSTFRGEWADKERCREQHRLRGNSEKTF